MDGRAEEGPRCHGQDPSRTRNVDASGGIGDDDDGGDDGGDDDGADDGADDGDDDCGDDSADDDSADDDAAVVPTAHWILYLKTMRFVSLAGHRGGDNTDAGAANNKSTIPAVINKFKKSEQIIN